MLLLALALPAAFAQEGGEAPADAPAAAAPATDPTAAPPAETPKPAPAVDVKPNAPAETGGDYEIDYEEEDEGEGDTAEGDEEPAPVKPAKKAPARKAPVAARPAATSNDRSLPTSQGTRSKNRFAPLLKSDAKSVYKKNGKNLDVDTD